MPHTIFHDLALNFKKDQHWSQIETQFYQALTALEWSPNGNHCAVGKLDGSVQILCIEDSFVPCCSIEPSTSKITSVSFNETSDLFASTSIDEKFAFITGFNVSDGKLNKRSSRVKCLEIPRFVSFMEDVARGQNILVAGTQSGLKLFDVDSETIFREVMIKGGATSLRSWHGCMLAVGVGDKSVQIWDVRVRDPVWVYRPQGAAVRPCFDVDNSNRVLIVADDKGGVTSLDLVARKEISKKKVMSNSIKALRISSIMRFLVSTDGESTSISNFNDPVNIASHQLEKPTSILGFRWHPEECSFLTRSSDKILRIWQYTPSQSTI
ncbi:unnamed protein product, partial [Mesorhabditis belari]|uniref:Uncharacterized protein n=1 Tax=Mesorhabditis belari TaxID=2138241 RepID=A0AAF3F3A8_9BILA